MASGILERGLTKTEFNELLLCTKDVFFFASKVSIIHPLKGKVKFNLYPFQKNVLFQFLRNRFNLILKFRQAGITELIALYCLWLAMYHSHKNIVIISIKDRVAKRVLKRIKFMYKNLPEHLRVPIVNGRPKEYGTAQEIEFANGSLITSIPTTEEAGRSEAVSLMVIDEAAIVRWISKIWAAAFPTLSTGGAAIVNSTPYGVGTWYHKTWVDACSGGNAFTPIRLKWQMHPERDQKWYDEMKATLGVRRTAQEVDGDFLTSGYSVFDLAAIREIEDNIASLTAEDIYESQYDGRLVLLEAPLHREDYFIGADIATGRDRDYSAFSIMTRTGREVGYFKGKIDPSAFAKLLMKIGRRYNDAVIAPEANDIGLAVVKLIQEAGYPSLYYTPKLLKKKGERKPEEQAIPGFYTTKANRPVIIDGLVDDINQELVEIKDPHFVKEAYTFIYDNRNKPIALGKQKANNDEEEILDDEDLAYNDDSILAKCITNFVRKGHRRSALILPQ